PAATQLRSRSTYNVRLGYHRSHPFGRTDSRQRQPTGSMRRCAMVIEHLAPSPLSHFDSAELLDVLSTGVVMLDSHLCVVYANVGAQDLLAVGLNKARGRPIGDLFSEPQMLDAILRRSLERGETCAGHEIVLTPFALSGKREPVVVDVTATPL